MIANPLVLWLKYQSTILPVSAGTGYLGKVVSRDTCHEILQSTGVRYSHALDDATLCRTLLY